MMMVLKKIWVEEREETVRGVAGGDLKRQKSSAPGHNRKHRPEGGRAEGGGFDSLLGR